MTGEVRPPNIVFNTFENYGLEFRHRSRMNGETERERERGGEGEGRVK